MSSPTSKELHQYQRAFKGGFHQQTPPFKQRKPSQDMYQQTSNRKSDD